jgi:hypothetical protein
VPCICSNKRRAVAPVDLIQTFYNIVFSPSNETTNNGKKTVALLDWSQLDNDIVGATDQYQSSAKNSANHPFFFAIDCRSAEERELGQFPKAYAFDSMVSIDNPNDVTDLIKTVETLASAAHLCLIGKFSVMVALCSKLIRSITSHQLYIQ